MRRNREPTNFRTGRRRLHGKTRRRGEIIGGAAVKIGTAAPRSEERGAAGGGSRMAGTAYLPFSVVALTITVWSASVGAVRVRSP